jgi:hypothetical protein
MKYQIYRENINGKEYLLESKGSSEVLTFKTKKEAEDFVKFYQIEEEAVIELIK